MTPDAREEPFAAGERLLAPFGGGAAAIRRAFDDLARRYAEPHRRYHTLDHVRVILNLLGDVPST